MSEDTAIPKIDHSVPVRPVTPPFRPQKTEVDYGLDALVNLGVVAFIVRLVLRGGKR